MDYYEELSVARTASLAEIRHSYRYLVRLLHPDRCADENLCLLAGLQMKRLNQILAVLSDAGQRSRYDAGLDLPPNDLPPKKSKATAWLWRAAEVAAIAGVLFYARSGGAWGGNRHGVIPSAGTRSAAATVPPPSGCSVPAETSNPMRLARRELDRLRAGRRHSPPETDAVGPGAEAMSFELPAATAPTGIQPISERPLPFASESLPAPSIPPASQRLAGNWYYIPSSPQAPSRGLYPPEYIELKLTEEGGILHGRYRGRYRITDRAIPPDVIFDFEGRSDPRSVRLPWNGAREAQGHVTLRLVSDDVLEVTWTASHLSADLGLASGTAKLIRQRRP